MLFCQELHNPKRNYENLDLNLGSQGCHNEKVLNITSRIWTQAPCITCKYFATGPSKLMQKDSTKLSLSRSQLRVHMCLTRKSDRQEWQSLVVLNGTKIFLNGTNISFLKFICGLLNRGVANSFWNHVIQISSRQVDFQDIFSNLWKVSVFFGNMYSLKSNTYFWGTVMFVQDRFLYLIVTKHKLTVCCHKQCFLYHVSFHLFLFSTVCLCILCFLLSLKHFNPFHCFFRILCFHDKCFILTCFNLTVSFSLVYFPYTIIHVSFHLLLSHRLIFLCFIGSFHPST